MFFTGDPTVKKKVDLGGRSSKERGRQKLLQQTKLEREQRQRLRLQTNSATSIQKVVRGRREIAAVRPIIRNEFCAIYGEFGEKADRSAFHPSAKYLPQLFFFFQASNHGDIQRLIVACRLLKQFLQQSSMVDLFTEDESSERAVAIYRQKRLASLCVMSLYVNCLSMKMELLRDIQRNTTSSDSSTLLLETLLTLTSDDSVWGNIVMDHLLKSKLFHFLRHILIQVQPDGKDARKDARGRSYLEHVVCFLAKRYVQRVQAGTNLSVQWGFPWQVLSIPLLWQAYPLLKQVCVDEGLWAHSVTLIASNLSEFSTLLPPDTRPECPSTICLLGNLIDMAVYALARADCTMKLGSDFSIVGRYMLEDLPAAFFRRARDNDGSADSGFEEMDIDDPGCPAVADPALEKQLLNAADPEFLKNLVRVTLHKCTSTEPVREAEAEAVGATCAFLYAIFITLPTTDVVTGLAYTAQLVPQLWPYIKRCHLYQSWPSMELVGRSPSDTQTAAKLLGWMLPLCVFCPVYSYLLMSVDNEEFYEQQRPLPLPDIVQLVSILKEALWQLLWVLMNKTSTAILQKPGQNAPHRMFSSQLFQQFVSKGASRLLAELHDRNSRRQFADPQDFHARETVDEYFLTQAEGENSRARDVLRQAPFLVPFKDRVRIFTSQIATARQEGGSHHHMSLALRIKIRRDHITEDAFAQLNSIPEEALRGMVRVTFVNELGVEEAGVDGGGIFKDFMEGITKTGFDVQYGLFKETADHLLYPNPASHMVSEEHLQYFEFFGKILGKAMSEGILVDIPFATFFLSKLRKKHNYLHDLPSLDPELYQNLLFLKHYDGDWAQLAVYFVVTNNEYGEQNEVELLPGGKDIQVTNTNVIKYIHLVANHRLNTQILQQSGHFLRGFQQIIKADWIDMFNEHEIQILISGSQEGMDVDDLRNNAHYTGGYDEALILRTVTDAKGALEYAHDAPHLGQINNHPVIEMFWEVVQKLDSALQEKFLKFVTGCSRGPLLGFKHLEPQFCIQRAASAPDGQSAETLDRLPTSATCMNLLKLPPYKSKEIIHEKLLYAITAGAGFDLS